MDCVRAIEIHAGIDVFTDCLSLRPDEVWKTRIAKEIASRDIFVLFWCSHAKTSEWVTWEWRTGLSERSREAIQVHALQNPSEAPPPDELKHLHFNHPTLYVAGHESSS